MPIDYLFFTNTYDRDTYFAKFDPLTVGATRTIQIQQNYICEHAFAIVYFTDRGYEHFTMGNTGKFHITIRRKGKTLREETVILAPEKSTPGAISHDYHRRELFITKFQLTKNDLENAEISVTVLEPMTNLEEFKGQIYAAILPTWRL